MTPVRHLIVLLSMVAGSLNAFAAEPARRLVVAHRGLLLHSPENTLANFRACLELRIGFEFDVRQTGDGQLVCIHDDTLDRTTNGKGLVATQTLDDVRRLDAGSWFDPNFAAEKVPTIDEVMKLIAEYKQIEFLVAVDLKAEGVEQQVVEIASHHGVLPRLLFIGRTIDEPTVRANIKNASDKAQTAAVANNSEEFAKALGAENADWVYFRYLPSRREAEAVRAAKKKAFIAGVVVSGLTPDNWMQAAEAGIDGILTDYPLELRTLLRQRYGR